MTDQPRTLSPPKYETGYTIHRERDGSLTYEAFVRPFSEDWYEFHPAETWWQAIAIALFFTADLPDCAFVGGGIE